MPDGRNVTPRDIVPGFAQLIRRKRRRLKLSLHALAKISGVGATSICNIEKERRSPSLRVAVQLACALGLRSSLRHPVRRKTEAVA